MCKGTCKGLHLVIAIVDVDFNLAKSYFVHELVHEMHGPHTPVILECTSVDAWVRVIQFRGQDIRACEVARERACMHAYMSRVCVHTSSRIHRQIRN